MRETTRARRAQWAAQVVLMIGVAAFLLPCSAGRSSRSAPPYPSDGAAPGPASGSGLATDGPLNLWPAHAMARIWRQQPVGQGGRVAIAAARNEYEPFQIVVSARGGDLTGITVQVSDLAGPAGTIKSWSIALYREHYVEVQSPSRLSPGPPGWYPDALIPFVSPVTGEPLDGPVYDAVPFNLSDGFNQPIWVDVYVPPATAAGIYTGLVTVTADAGLQATVPVELEVWSFMLPRRPAQQSSFGVIRQHLDQLYGLRGANDQAMALRRSFYQELIRHRLAPAILDDTIIPVDPQTGSVNLETAQAPGVSATAAATLHYYLDRLGMAAVGLPIFQDWPFPQALTTQRAQAKAYLAGWGTHFIKHGWADRLYIYLIDEPNSQAAYQLIRDWGALIDEVNAEYGTAIRFLVTEQPAPQQAAWGDLYGPVAIWAPCCDYVWQDMEDAAGQRTIAQRQALGEAVWWYTAMVQPSEAWLRSHGDPATLTEDYAPVWLLDYPPANLRIPSWLNQLSGLTGLLYWDTVYAGRSPDVWADPANLVVGRPPPQEGADYFLSDGLLLYPGHVETTGFDGPVPTMRLKWIREGMDDYDYIALLSGIGQRAFALEQVRTIARGWSDWDQDAAALYAARRQLGRRLDAHADQLAQEAYPRLWLPLVVRPRSPQRATWCEQRRRTARPVEQVRQGAHC